MPPTRLSLVMSGAVSLGSFHAGVVTELLHALKWHADHGNPYELDVVTGASAGSITAALVAHVVMNDYQRRGNFHRAWVDLAVIDKLLLNPPDPMEFTFLSPNPIYDIAKTCIAPPYTTAGKAPFAPSLMRVAFTLSNMNGINRIVESSTGDPFVSTFFDDRKDFKLTGDPVPAPQKPHQPWSVQDAATWDTVCMFAIASGAFPLAFPPIHLQRFRSEFPLLDPAFPFTPDPMEFTYVDGGTFNNQPLAEAVRLCRQADADVVNPPRKYLFVNASAKTATYDGDFGQKPPDPELWRTGMRLAIDIFAQSRTSDWIRSLLINDQIQWRDDFFTRLVGIVQQTSVEDPAPLLAGLRTTAGSIFEAKSHRLEAREDHRDLDQTFQRTAKKYEALLVPVDNPVRRDVLTWIFLIMDHIADLNERKRLNLATIAPPGGLPGEGLQAFAGFFKQNWREYNYRKGRLLAHDELAKFLGAYERETGDAAREYEIPPEWEAFPNETLKDADEGPRKVFRAMMVKRAQDYAVKLKPKSWWTPDWIIRKWVGDYAYSEMTKILELPR
jgi:hypothetical protein